MRKCLGLFVLFTLISCAGKAQKSPVSAGSTPGNVGTSGSSESDPNAFLVVVDYSRTMAEMVSASHFNMFIGPSPKEDSSLSVKGGRVESEIVLVACDDSPTRSMVYSKNELEETRQRLNNLLDKRGLRHARIEEFLALFELHPWVLERYKQVEAVVSSSSFFVAFHGKDEGRVFVNNIFGSAFCMPGTWYAAARK